MVQLIHLLSLCADILHFHVSSKSKLLNCFQFPDEPFASASPSVWVTSSNSSSLFSPKPFTLLSRVVSCLQSDWSTGSRDNLSVCWCLLFSAHKKKIKARHKEQSSLVYLNFSQVKPDLRLTLKLINQWNRYSAVTKGKHGKRETARRWITYLRIRCEMSLTINMSQCDFNCTQYSYLQDFMTICQSTSKHSQSNREQERNSEKNPHFNTKESLLSTTSHISFKCYN